MPFTLEFGRSFPKSPGFVIGILNVDDIGFQLVEIIQVRGTEETITSAPGHHVETPSAVTGLTAIALPAHDAAATGNGNRVTSG